MLWGKSAQDGGLQWVSESTRLDQGIRVTNAGREHFDENLSLLGLLELNIFDGQLIIRFLEDGGLVGLWQCGSHADSRFDIPVDGRGLLSALTENLVYS